MTSKLCIIIPAFNAEKTIEDCIMSIMAQDFDDMTVIVVDDGSTDGTYRAIEKLTANDNRFLLLRKENGGLSDARNYGIERADADYLMFVDADDELQEGTLKSLLQTLDKHPEYDILEFGVCGYKSLTLEDREYDSPLEYWLQTEAYLHSYAWNKVYRRRLFEKVRYPRGVVFEDIATLPSLLKEAKKIASTSTGKYIYKPNPYGITHKAGGEEWRMLLKHNIKALEWAYDGSDEAMRNYMHVVDCQLMASELTGDKPKLKKRHVRLSPLSTIHKLKALSILLFGMDLTCQANRLFRKFVPRR